MQPISALENTVVPFEKLRRRSGHLIKGQNCERLAIQRIVMAAVVELFADPAADLDLIVERHREVALIEEIMEIGAEQQAIVHFVRTTFSIRLDVASREGRKRPLSCDGTPAGVGVCDLDSECTLTKPRLD